MITVYFFMVFFADSLIQAGPFSSIDQCKAARSSVYAARSNYNTRGLVSECYEGTWGKL